MSMSYGGNTINDTDGGVLRPISSVMRNRIINGDMRIDQRNAGASVTIPAVSTIYTLDRFLAYADSASRFSVQQNAGAVTPPAGFTNYLGCTSLSAYTVGSSEQFIIGQQIEGFNAADLGWGTANAATVTLSFWVRSSLTGTFGGSLRNSAANRVYTFSYTISAANTWEQKSITIVGDTTGTWLTNNGIGIRLVFSLGAGASVSGTAGSWSANSFTSATGATSVVGTNGATFYITGVQLEVGSSATGFEYRQHGTELALCQRYLPAFSFGAGEKLIVGQAVSGTQVVVTLPFPVTTRAVSTGITSSAASNFALGDAVLNYAGSATGTAIAFESGGINEGSIRLTCTAGMTAGSASLTLSRFANTFIYFTGCEL